MAKHDIICREKSKTGEDSIPGRLKPLPMLSPSSSPPSSSVRGHDLAESRKGTRSEGRVGRNSNGPGPGQSLPAVARTPGNA